MSRVRRKLSSARKPRRTPIWKSKRYLHEYEHVVILRDMLIWQENTPIARSASELCMFYPNRYDLPKLRGAMKRMLDDGLLTQDRTGHYKVHQAIAGVYVAQRLELVA